MSLPYIELFSTPEVAALVKSKAADIKVQLEKDHPLWIASRCRDVHLTVDQVHVLADRLISWGDRWLNPPGQDRPAVADRWDALGQAALDCLGAQAHLRRGHVYYGLMPMQHMELDDRLTACLTAYWVVVPHLFQPLSEEGVCVSMDASIGVHVLPRGEAVETEWSGQRLMLDRERRMPFPVPEEGAPPEKWTPEELALAVILGAIWLGHRYVFTQPVQDTALSVTVLTDPPSLVQFDLRESRWQREGLRDWFPWALRDGVYLERRMSKEGLAAQICLVAIRQQAASEDVYEHLVRYAASAVGGQDATDYARMAVQHAVQKWLFPVSPGSLWSYLKHVGRGKRREEAGKEIQLTEHKLEYENEAPAPTSRSEMVLDGHDSHMEGKVQRRSVMYTDQLFPPEQVARMLGVSRQSVHNWVRQGSAHPASTDPILFNSQEVQRLRDWRQEKGLRTKLIEVISARHGITRQAAAQRVKRRIDKGMTIRDIALDQGMKPR